MTLRSFSLRYILNPLAGNVVSWFMPKWRRRGGEAYSALKR